MAQNNDYYFSQYYGASCVVLLLISLGLLRWLQSGGGGCGVATWTHLSRASAAMAEMTGMDHPVFHLGCLDIWRKHSQSTSMK